MTHSSEFRWATGVECSFIPHLGIDQYRWTQHDRLWREDFALLAGDLGCRWLRYALPWHEIETTPGRCDWTWFDERLAHAESLGIDLLLDLVHFGVPPWLPDAFADADLPGALERFARAFGERYAGRVRTVCPINEPLITALFCGDIGLWPPYGRGLRSYTAVLTRVTQALSRSIRVLRETMPGVEILVSDSLEVAVTHEDSDETTSPYLKESLRADVTRRMQRRHIVLDLTLGRVNPRHPLHSWLLAHGMSEYDLRWLERNAQTIDVVGLDYYEHTEVELYTTPEGYYRQRELRPPVGLYQAAQDYWKRYRIPLMITETSVGGADDTKIAWLDRSVHDVRRLRAEGFPVIGYTWWPAIDHLDWDGALLHQTGHIHPVGIYRLTRERSGALTRSPTGLRDAYRRLIAHGDAAAGELVSREEPAAAAASLETAPAPAGSRGALGRPIIALSRVRWEGLWQRPQQLLERLSKRRRVLYLEPVRWTETEDEPRLGLNFHPHIPNLVSVTTHLPSVQRGDPALASETRRRLVSEVLAKPPLAGRFDAPLLWADDFEAAEIFRGSLGAHGLVLDCFAEPPTPALLGAATVAFAAGRQVERAARESGARVHFAPNGVHVPAFSRARRGKLAIPHDLEFIPAPVLGYFGAIDERLDYELIAALAAANDAWSVVLVGPVSEPERLPRRNNLFWLGPRPYLEMPNYARGFRVGLVPFLVNERTRFERPVKVGEYLRSGLPVVATALEELGDEYAGAIRIAQTPEEFIARCHEALEDRDPAGARLTVRRGWQRLARDVERWIA